MIQHGRPPLGVCAGAAEEAWVTAGVTVPRRGERRLEGRATYHSVLSVLATRCRQEGHEEAAVEMVQAAEKVEDDFSERLKSFLRDRTLADLPTAEFFNDLAAATAECVAVWSRGAPDLLAVARVNEMAGVLAHLEGTLLTASLWLSTSREHCWTASRLQRSSCVGFQQICRSRRCHGGVAPSHARGISNRKCWRRIPFTHQIREAPRNKSVVGCPARWSDR